MQKISPPPGFDSRTVQPVAYQLHKKRYIIQEIKDAKFKWLGHLFIVDELHLAENTTLTNSDGTKTEGRPLVRWMDSAEEEEDLKISGGSNWKRNGSNKNGVEKRSWNCQG